MLRTVGVLSVVTWLAAASSPTAVELKQVTALERAVEDLVGAHGPRYPYGAAYLARVQRMAAFARTAPVADDAFAELQRDALLANPLLTAQPILFTVHVPDSLGTHNYMRPSGYRKRGSALKLLDVSTGRARTLVSAPDGIIRRPCVHFDGRRIVFAMSRNPRDNFHIYEITVDPAARGEGGEGGEVPVRPLTCAPDVSDVDPIYLPDGRIAFASTRDIKYVPCDSMIVPQLFRMDGDGANIHQITRSTVHENELSLLPDGRILYSRWDYVDRNFGDGHGFWVANPDGCNPSLIWGNNTAHPAAGWSARIIPGTGNLLCILGTHHGSLGGALAILDPARAIEGRQSILQTWPSDNIRRFDDQQPLDLGDTRDTSDVMRATRTWPAAARKLVPTDANMRLYRHLDIQRNVRPWYNSPYPLSDTYFLCVRAVSWRDAPAVYLVDTFGNDVCLYAEDPGCFSPMPLAVRPTPVAIPTRRDYGNGDGVFTIQNVYEGTHMAGVEAGSVKAIRVVEALSKRGKSNGNWYGLGRQEPGVNWTDFNAKRILGTAPVEADGSASFYVPCDRYLYFQLLDGNGMMIQSMRSGTSVHSGETLGCIGCHDSRRKAGTSSSLGAPPLASKREPSTLAPWYGPSRAFSYAVEIQPIFDRHCVSCHDFGKKGGKTLVLAGDKTPSFCVSYAELWYKGYVGAIGAGPAAHLPAGSWGSRASPLIQTLKKGHHDVALDEESLNRLVTWIDINGPYYPTSYAVRDGQNPGRSPLKNEQMKRLVALTGVSLGQIGHARYFKGPMISFDRPDLSPCLATLQKGSARHRDALAIIRLGRETLAKTPRADMSGFVPWETDRRRQAHYARHRALEQASRQAIREGRKLKDSAVATPDTMGL